MTENEGVSCLAGICIGIVITLGFQLFSNLRTYNIYEQGVYKLAEQVAVNKEYAEREKDPVKLRELYTQCVDALGDKKFCFNKYYR